MTTIMRTTAERGIEAAHNYARRVQQMLWYGFADQGEYYAHVAFDMQMPKDIMLEATADEWDELLAMLSARMVECRVQAQEAAAKDDKDKLLQLAARLYDIQIPECATDDGKRVAAVARSMLLRLVTYVVKS